MVGKHVLKYADEQVSVLTISNSTNQLDVMEWSTDTNVPHYSPIQVATTVCLVIGICQVNYLLLSLLLCYCHNIASSSGIEKGLALMQLI